jgi:hypothetical protein
MTAHADRWRRAIRRNKQGSSSIIPPPAVN